jgi:hypothetical protein
MVDLRVLQGVLASDEHELAGVRVRHTGLQQAGVLWNA